MRGAKRDLAYEDHGACAILGLSNRTRSGPQMHASEGWCRSPRLDAQDKVPSGAHSGLLKRAELVGAVYDQKVDRVSEVVRGFGLTLAPT